jgi:homocysteine S-methyltransferase
LPSQLRPGPVRPTSAPDRLASGPDRLASGPNRLASGADRLASVLAGRRALVLDGGLSTELERRGHDISGRLWSARLLHDDPQAVVAAHAAFLRAGAEVITTASYQATPEGLAQAGFDPADGIRLLRRSVALAQQARDQTLTPTSAEAWIAGSVGPFGAMLANGSEYTGDYGNDVDLHRLRTFHRPRLEILADAGVDVLAVETIPSLLETEALVAELTELGHPSWLSLTTVLDPDGVVRTRRGEPAEQAFALAADAEAIVAVGVNCTAPEGLAAAIEVAARASGKPVVAYPNSGEGWNAQSRTWTDDGSAGFGESELQAWLTAGAKMIGGCCRVGPDLIADVASHLAQP